LDDTAPALPLEISRVTAEDGGTSAYQEWPSWHHRTGDEGTTLPRHRVWRLLPRAGDRRLVVLRRADC